MVRLFERVCFTLGAAWRPSCRVAKNYRTRRDRAILSTLLFHALRRDELCKLKVRDFRHTREGVPHLRVTGNGGKTRYLPLHAGTHGLIHEYLNLAGHDEDDAGGATGAACRSQSPLFCIGVIEIIGVP